MSVKVLFPLVSSHCSFFGCVKAWRGRKEATQKYLLFSMAFVIGFAFITGLFKFHPMFSTAYRLKI